MNKALPQADLDKPANPAGFGVAVLGASVLGTGLLAAVLVIILFGDPNAHRPMTSIEIQPIVHRAIPKNDWVDPVGRLGEENSARGLHVVEAEQDKAQIRTIIRPLYAGSALVADPALIENTEHGPLPRISDTGRTPLQAYQARSPVLAKKIPISIVMNGFGLGSDITKSAVVALPPEITLSFAARNGDLQNWVNEARARGHEVLLEVPMEPADYPDSDPGPHTLRTGHGEVSNLQHLAWAMSRFTGYIGITNLQGSRFLSDHEALTPVMTYLSRRGLVFVDTGHPVTGHIGKSVAADAARQADTAFARGHLRLDAIQDGAAIDRALSDLEKRAREQNGAIGTAFVYPISVERIAQWSRDLASRGFVLVPVSAIIEKNR